MISYFGFGTNKDLDMMAHMIGRENIKGEAGKLIGYEICIQKADQFRTEIPPTSPIPVSPKDLILKSWGPEFEMFVSRPNPEGIAYGTIWEITSEELELVREWELVEYGAQEDAWGIAINAEGEPVQVITQSFMKPPIDIDRVITGEDYNPYIWPKEAMLKRADELRLQYLKFKEEAKTKEI
jgi:hypothetical protein